MQQEQKHNIRTDPEKRDGLFARLLARYGYTQQIPLDTKTEELEESENGTNEELKSILRTVIKEELNKLPRNADDTALNAVAQTVKDIMPALQMDRKDIAEFLNPEYRHKQFLTLQGEDINRQVLVEVSDLHLAISALEKTMIVYDENRRKDGHFLAGHVVNAVRDEFAAERERREKTNHDKTTDKQETKPDVSKRPNRLDYPNIMIPFLVMTAFNVLLILVLFLLLR